MHLLLAMDALTQPALRRLNFYFVLQIIESKYFHEMKIYNSIEWTYVNLQAIGLPLTPIF